jgi:mannose-6-phosphate isomerase-like protein (cupin superfamily)
MDLETIKSNIVTNVYHIRSDKKNALHKHQNHNEIFYCIKGEGFGVLEHEEIELAPGGVFVVPAGTMHTLRTEGNLWVSSFLIPVLHSEI